jgi:CXXX repeat peptide maturase
MPMTDDRNWCGAGKMLAIDADGVFYPCVRFAPYSLNNRPGRAVGSCFDGMDPNRLRPFIAATRSSQSPPECMACEVATGCAWCSGCNYDVADTATLYQRATYICELHKARVRANDYFWDRLHRHLAGAATLPRPADATTAPVKDEAGAPGSLPALPLEPASVQRLVFLLDASAPSFCYYDPAGPTPQGPTVMPAEVLARGLEYAAQHGLAATVLHARGPADPDHTRLLAAVAHAAVVPDQYASETPVADTVVVVDAGGPPGAADELTTALGNVVLRIARACLDDLAPRAIALLGRCERLNLCLLEIGDYTDEDIRRYSEALSEIGTYLIAEYGRGRAVEFSALTDRLLLTRMNNCNAGVSHATLAPDGMFYPCPAFYYAGEGQAVGRLESGLQIPNPQLLRADHAPICSRCDAYHCKRCVYLNWRTTDELNTPSRQQCVVSHAEREAARTLLEKLRPIAAFAAVAAMPRLGHDDPFAAIANDAATEGPAAEAARIGAEWRQRLQELDADGLRALADEVAQAISARGPS